MATSPRPPERFHSEGDIAELSLSSSPSSIARVASLPDSIHVKKWRAAALKLKDLPDPWKGHEFDSLPEEVARRHMYNPHTGKWRTDEIIVKIQSESFAHGAMRECYRMKKLSKFSQHPDWRNASNYVAKRYMKEVSSSTYFSDVKLQMDAKLWGEEYNKFNPPKKVDIVQTYIIEVSRDHAPAPILYCVEHLIEGNYIKYNSNSGFVSEMNRLTPQAFSHFTFERSSHRIIVVDIQGVGDLYTDPQLHTMDQGDYGEANLGSRGVALFFSSHVCSSLCRALGLTPFDLSEAEISHLAAHRHALFSASTAIHPSASEPLIHSSLAPPLSAGLRHLSLGQFPLSSQDTPFVESPLDSPGITMTIPPSVRLESVCESVEGEGEGEGEEEEEEGEGEGEGVNVQSKASSGTSVTKKHYLVPPLSTKGTSSDTSSRSASVENEKTRLREEGEEGEGVREGDSLRVLGQVHLDLASYHELGRFSSDFTPDLPSALHHLRKAADCRLPQALLTLAHIHLQRAHDEFKDLSVESTAENEEVGVACLVRAAGEGMRCAMVEAAQLYDVGGWGEEEEEGDGGLDHSPRPRQPNWPEAVQWYQKALLPTDLSDELTSSGATPGYTLLARLAEMHRSGGHGLDSDPQKAGDFFSEAADQATAAMKGRLANKWYMLAEEAWSEVD